MSRWAPSLRLQDQAASAGQAASTAGEVPTHPEVARVLEDVLAGPDFQQVEPSLLESWLSAAWEWIRDLLTGIPLPVPEGAAATAAWFLAMALVGATALVWARWVFRWAARGTGRSASTSDADAGTHPSTSAEWLRLAAARAAEGDLRAAATALYQGALRVLDERGVVSFHPSKTPGEYATEATRHGEGLGIDAATFLRSFQHFRFGEVAPTLAAYRRLEKLAPLDAGDEA